MAHPVNSTTASSCSDPDVDLVLCPIINTDISGVTRNSGAPGQISKSTPASPFPPLSPLPLPPPFPFFASPLPFLLSLFPTFSFSFAPSPSPYNGCGSLGRLAPPASRQTHFFCVTDSPNTANLLSFTNMHKTRI